MYDDIDTDRLSDIYGEWLVANGFEGDEPANELLMFACDRLTNRQREWLEDFCIVYKAREEYEDKARALWPDPVLRACNILCDKWVARLGIGFHPDTDCENYEPPLTRVEKDEYMRDMRFLFAQPCDPYAIGLSAMQRAGLIEDEK